MAFVVFFSGEQARTKILKICEAFGASCYPVPEDVTKQRQITREVSLQLRICPTFLNSNMGSKLKIFLALVA